MGRYSAVNLTGETRLKVIFPNLKAFKECTVQEFSGAEVQISNERRKFVVLESSSATDPDAAYRAASICQQKYGAQIFKDDQYEIDSAF